MDNTITTDLNLFTDIFPKLNDCITRYGSAQLKYMLENIIIDNDGLLERQNIIKKITMNNIQKNKLRRLLNKIYSLQDPIDIWFGLSYCTDTDDLYFGYDICNNSLLLDAFNKMKIASIFIILMIYIVIYILLKYWGIDIPIKDYLLGIYQGYHSMAKFIVSFAISKQNINNIIAHILSTMYTIYQVYSFYNTYETSISHYKKCNKFMQEYNDIVKVIYTIKKIHENSFLEFSNIGGNISYMSDIFNEDSNLGYALVTKKRYHYIDTFRELLSYIGTIDAYISISDMLYKGYTLPTFIFNSDRPILLVDQVFNPLLNAKTQVANDFISFDNNLTIITGPNKAGKSTYIRSLFLSVYLSQTLGISCCKEILMTPFTYLFTYLNVPDIIGRESLFEAELNRVYKFYKSLTDLKQRGFTFAIIDELLTGTNPYEGVAASYSICKFISENKSNISIISTHFHSICDGIVDVQFLKFIAIKVNSKYHFPYKIYPGISNQYIAIELLEDKGYDKGIVQTALGKLNHLKNLNI